MVAPMLFGELATLPDPRGFQGRGHALSAFLGLVTLAMLMGRTSLIGVASAHLASHQARPDG